MVTNDVEFKFFGIRRGGQHAIIHWIACHFEEPVWFVNDIGEFNAPYIHNDDTKVYAPDEFRDPTKIPEKEYWAIQKPVFFHSYEEKPFKPMNFDSNQSVVGESGQSYSILIMRDPLNTFASRITQAGYICRVQVETIERWKQYAREALGLTNYLQNKVVINYNFWVSSEIYRRRIERLLHLPATDNGKERVYGLGSSFDKNKMDGRASEMNVLNRWKGSKGDSFFRKVTRDRDLWELSDRLFGRIPDSEQFRPRPKMVRAEPKMLEGKRLVYIRTPKTASTTIKVMLKKYADEKELKVLYKFHQMIYDNITDAPYDLSLHHIVHTGRNIQRLRELVPGHVLITSVRNPLDRARSHYNHVGPNGPINRAAKRGVSFNDWYPKSMDLEGEYARWKEPILLRHWTNNAMASFMGFSDIRDVTMENFADRFAFAFVAEEMELSLKVFFALFGWETPDVPSFRIAKYEKDAIPDDVVKKFKKRNKIDYQIYKTACELLHVRAKELGCENMVHTDE